MSEIQKKVLRSPTLPPSIQGDGRYLISLLRDFLTEQAQQINAANSFTADEIEAEKQGKILAPRNFRLTFTRLGGHLVWERSAGKEEVDHYETRTNKNVGSEVGLLERTTNTESDRLPLTYVGHIYLFAVNVKGEASTPAELHYTKARPVKPQNIAMTKTQEGTLITFLEIPLDCLGAHIYVNDVRYESGDNLFLYTGGAVIEKLRVAYFDQYGDGEYETVYCVIPDVEDFLVERNGAQLDFSWSPLPIYNVRYEVKVGVTPEWDKALTLFTTKLNKHRYVYPNTGTYYMLVKAIDEHDNYSRNAAYFMLTNLLDIHKNVIIRLDQEKTGYTGVKHNFYYDTARQALLLEKKEQRGEYIMPVKLPQKYRARNWLEASVIGETNNDYLFDDLDYAWDSTEAQNTMWNGTVGDLRGVAVTYEIARFDAALRAEYSAFIGFDGELDAVNATPTVKLGKAVYAPSQWWLGIILSPSCEVFYNADIPSVFSLSFWLRLRDGISDTTIVCLEEPKSRTMRIVYNSLRGRFELICTDGGILSIEFCPARSDCLAFGVVQTEAKRRFFLYSLMEDRFMESEIEKPPMGGFSYVHFYDKE